MQVTELWQYPIKSCKGNSIPSAVVQAEGFMADRRFQWVLDNGRFVSQREFPQLALVHASYQGENLEIRYQERLWTLTPDDFQDKKTVTIWKDQVQADAYVGRVNTELSELIGIPMSLVSMPEKGRPISDDCADGHVSFADGLPYLLTNMQSLADLNGRLDDPVTMNHFRANIIVDGDVAYEEDHWNRVKIGNVVLRAVKPCARCIMTTIDPTTANRRTDAEPLKTLSGYRMLAPGKIIFGMNMVAEELGVISVGDQLEFIKDPR